LHKRDEALLNRIKEFFKVGALHKDRDFIVYKVGSLKELNETIIPHFEKYPLLTQKSFAAPPQQNVRSSS